MIEKIVKARKEYKCDLCGGVIRKGNKHHYISYRQAKYADDHETQIGVEFISYRRCLKDNCDGMLKYVNNLKQYIQQCTKGIVEYQQGYELDHYVECHAVYAPTGDYFCVNCGVAK